MRSARRSLLPRFDLHASTYDDAEAALLTNDSLLREARRAMQIDRLALDLSLGSIAENSLGTPTSPVP